MFVRLSGPESGPGAAGRWMDAASSEHGDLLDVIRESCGLVEFREVAEEARRFLALPHPEPRAAPRPPAPVGSPEAARRLWAISRPIAGTLAEAYLRGRGIANLGGCEALRFHPRCWYRGDDDDPRDQLRDAWPALIAAVTALDGAITGVHRTWLDPASACKAPVSTPRRAMGLLLGNGVRFGGAVDAMVAGEGLETILSLRQVMPSMAVVAGLSASHLAALELPIGLRRLYIARDDDLAGRRAVESLIDHARAVGVEAMTLMPELGDFNEDLRRLGAEALRDGLHAQLAPDDKLRLRST
jgi:hypothetical protein